jgi:hypothetical protein
LRSHYRLVPKETPKLSPDDLIALTLPAAPAENPVSASVQVHSAATADGKVVLPSAAIANSVLKEAAATHE